VSPSFWSDENRLLVSRLGGWAINFKFIARKLGWIKTRSVVSEQADEPSQGARLQSGEERLRQAVDESRYEDR